MLRSRWFALLPRLRFASSLRSQDRVQLAGLHQILFRHGLSEGICNHLSAMTREAGREAMLISPYGRLWSQVTASSLLAVSESDIHAERTDGVETSALTIHWSIHASRPDARVVLHTHTPYATAMASLHDPRLPMCNQNCLRFFGDVAYDLSFGGASTDMEEGARIADQLGPTATVLLMQNHGVTVVGPSVAIAFDRLYYFERACKTYLLAMASGRAVSDLSATYGPERCRGYRDYCRDFEKDSAPLHLEAELQVLKENSVFAST